MKFDSAAFKAAWREACEKRDVDPVEGATSFQVAGYKAEVAEARKRKQAKHWATPDAIYVWKNWGVSRSETEAAAINLILRDAKQLQSPQEDKPGEKAAEAMIPVDVVIREIWQELTAEMRRDVVHHAPERLLRSMPRAGVVVMV